MPCLRKTSSVSLLHLYSSLVTMGAANPSATHAMRLTGGRLLISVHRQRQLRRPGYRNGKRDDETQRHMQHLRAVLGVLGFGTGKDETERDKRNKTEPRPREQVRTL